MQRPRQRKKKSAASCRATLGLVHTAVRTDHDDLDGWKCYTAGPPVMIDALTEVVLAQGLQWGDLHADVFFTPETKTETVGLTAAG
jgi:ferredoxin-NAD(P)+ reductase (naphthalene dioxygenase ferredoxin-specific)